MRLAIKKAKADIDKISSGLNDPVSLINLDRGMDLASRLKDLESEIRVHEQEKTTQRHLYYSYLDDKL